MSQPEIYVECLPAGRTYEFLAFSQTDVTFHYPYTSTMIPCLAVITTNILDTLNVHNSDLNSHRRVLTSRCILSLVISGHSHEEYPSVADLGTDFDVDAIPFTPLPT